MKKIIRILLPIILVVGIIYVAIYNPEIIKEKAHSVYLFYEDKFGEKLEPYDSNFKVNSLSVKTDSYYYNTLTDSQKNIYNYVAHGVKSLSNDVYVNGYEYIDEETTSKDVEKAVYRFSLDHPEVFYLNDKYVISTNTNIFTTKLKISFTYTVASNGELDEKINKIETVINEILSKSNEKENDFDKELYLHDYLASNVKYYSYEDESKIPAVCHTMYGALVDKVCVCDGYSKALKLLLNMSDIESIISTGNLKDESHAWNLVKIDDMWYNVDVTSDKSIKYNEKTYIVHSYFNITDELIKSSHSIDNEDIIPKATSNDMNYYIKLGKNISSKDAFNDKFGSLLKNNDNELLLEFSTDYTDVPNKISSALSNKFYNSEYVDKNTSKFSYYNILNTYVLLKMK